MISAISDGTTRLKRNEEEASDLHKARVASLSPNPSLPDQSLTGLPDVSKVQTIMQLEEELMQLRQGQAEQNKTLHEFHEHQKEEFETRQNLTATQLTLLANELYACEREMQADKKKTDFKAGDMRGACKAMGQEIDELHAKTKQLRDDGKMVCDLYMKEKQMVIHSKKG